VVSLIPGCWCSVAVRSAGRRSGDVDDESHLRLPPAADDLVSGQRVAMPLSVRQDICPCGALVAKVAHHGSRAPTSSAFLTAVEPLTAVISVGEDNRYGLPSPQTLDRLRARPRLPHRPPRRRRDQHGRGEVVDQDAGPWRVGAADATAPLAADRKESALPTVPPTTSIDAEFRGGAPWHHE